MSSTYTTRIRLEKQGSGENASTWGDKLNESVIDLVDSAVGAVTSISLAGVGTAYTVSSADGVSDEARSAVLYFHGSVSTAVSITIPAVEKSYIIGNNTTGGFGVKIKPAGGTEQTIPAGQTTLIYTDGTAVKNVLSSITGMSQVGASLGNFTSVVANDVAVSANLSATNITGVTGGFSTKVSAGALEVSGVVSGTSAVFSGIVSCSAIVGDGSGLSGLTVTPRSYLAGMNLSMGSDNEHDIQITAGIAKNSTNASDLTLSSTIEKQIDATWADGTGAGGLASGASLSANTTYHVFAIAVTAGTDAGFDSSATAANFVANNDVTAFRRIGSVITDGSSNIRPFRQRGDKFLLQDPILSYTDKSIGATGRTTITLNTPSGIVTDAIFTHLLFGTFTDAQYVYRPLAMPDVSVVDNAFGTAPTSAAMGSLGNRGAGFIEFGGNERLRDFAWEVTCETNTSSQIGVRTQVAGGSADGSDSNAFQTTGWYDSRGKDD